MVGPYLCFRSAHSRCDGLTEDNPSLAGELGGIDSSEKDLGENAEACCLDARVGWAGVKAGDTAIRVHKLLPMRMVRVTPTFLHLLLALPRT